MTWRHVWACAVLGALRLQAQAPAGSFAHADTAALRRTLNAVAATHHGVLGYAVRNLDTGEALSRRERTRRATDRELLVTPAWLAAHLHDRNLVLLEVGDSALYAEKHIPGARYVSLGDISVSDRTGKGLSLELPPVAELHDRLESLGISDGSRIVVYYGNDRVTASTRVVLTLDYAGLGASTSLLDGGEGAWVREGHEVTSAVPPGERGKLSPLRTRPIVVDAEYVRAHIGKAGVSIVDARLPAFYNGEQTGSGVGGWKHATGHIASAKNVPYIGVTDSANVFRSPAELEAMFTKAGIAPGDTVVTYCHIGQQATATLFAARLLGHPVKFYDGSFEDWSRHAGYPVENPSAGKKPEE